MARCYALISLLLLLCAIATTGCLLQTSHGTAALAAGSLSTDLGLPRLAVGARTFQASTHTPNDADAHTLAPGATMELLNEAGPAVIQNFWMTFGPPPNETSYLRKLVLRMYWDGESEPSVECPIGDFFGTGFGEYQTWQSALLGVTSGGFFSYFPMPYRSHARITLTNEAPYAVHVFYHLLGQRLPALDADVLYFHAQWRRENPTTEGVNYRFAEISGRGFFAGVTHHMQALSSGDKMNFLEGDEYYYVDDETTASVRGTGTEDYYQGAWYFKDGPFNAPWHGLMRMDGATKRVSCYRLHWQDRIHFTKGLRAEIEHGQRTYNEAKVDYSSVAYWYQQEPHRPFEPLNPDREAVKPAAAFLIPGAIEFEGQPGAGPYYVNTYNGGWSNDMAGLYKAKAIGETTPAIEFQVPTAGRYAIGINLVGHDHSGIAQVLIDDQPVGDPVDGYTADPMDDYLLCRNRALGLRPLATISLTAGAHKLGVRVVGKNPAAQSQYLLIDCVTVSPAQ